MKETFKELLYIELYSFPNILPLTWFKKQFTKEVKFFELSIYSC